MIHRGRNPLRAAVFVTSVLLVSTVPTVQAAREISPRGRIAAEILTTEDLPSGNFPPWMLDRERTVPHRLLRIESPFFRSAGDFFILDSWERYWRTVDGESGIHIEIIDFRNRESARSLVERKGTTDPSLRLPASAEGGASVRSPNNTSLYAVTFVGRVSIAIEVFVAGIDADVRASSLLDEMLTKQAENVVERPDIPGTNMEAGPVGNLIDSSIRASVLGVPVGIGLITLVGDRAARRRLRWRFIRRPPVPTHAVDVAERSQQRLVRHKMRVAVRIFIVLVALEAAIRAHLGLVFTGTVIVAAYLGWSMVEDRLPALRVQRRTVPLLRGWTALASVLGLAVAMAFVALGFAVIFIGIAISAIGFPGLDTHDVETWRVLLLLLGVLIVGCAAVPVTIVRRLAMRRMGRVIEKDMRPTVLFLRSFADDGIRMRARRTGRSSPLDRISLRRWDRFEEVIAAEVNIIGPVVALSEPNERLPPRLGAARRSYEMQDWKKGIEDLIDGSILIVVTVGRTEALSWEMGQLRARGALNRSIFLIPPTTLADERARLHALARNLGIDAALLDHAQSGLEVIAIVVPSLDHPTIITSVAPDDVSFEEAIASGLWVLNEARRREALGQPLPAPVPAIPRPLRLPDGIYFPPGKAPRVRAWYLRWKVYGLIGFLFSALVGACVAALPPAPDDFAAVVRTDGVPTAFIRDKTGRVLSILGGDELVRVDVKSNAVVHVAKFDLPVSDLVLDNDGMFVSSERMGVVAATDSEGKARWQAQAGVGVRGILLHDGTLYVVSPATNELIALDPHSGARVASTQLERPWDTAIVDGRLYVSLGSGEEVVEVNTATMAVAARHRTIAGPRELYPGADGLWVIGADHGEVALYDTSSWTERASFTTAAISPIVNAWKNELVVLVDEDQLRVISGTRVVTTIKLRRGPVAVGFDEDGRVLVSEPRLGFIGAYQRE